MNRQSFHLGKVEEFHDGIQIRKCDRKRVAVAHLGGRYFAFDALCPHARGPMERSEIDGMILSCPLHVWRFDLAAGGTELHGYRRLPMYDVEIIEDRLYVRLDAAG